jgi:CDP-diacylglycerol--glycerol-3-phosphate 3-phosphatidyltransferase
MNLPNTLTAGRLVLAIVVFVLLAFVQGPEEPRGKLPAGSTFLLDVALVLFIVAAVTDSLDGWLARKNKLVTPFGVVADPLMDKIVVSGILIYFCSYVATRSIVAPWMVVTMITREFLVTGLRGFAESRGQDLFAKLLGKMKMVAQCVTLVALFLYLGHFQPDSWARSGCSILVWITLLLTLISGVGYLPAALGLARTERSA